MPSKRFKESKNTNDLVWLWLWVYWLWYILISVLVGSYSMKCVIHVCRNHQSWVGF
uniref:Uncharacterized protein n=1 Tax=Helianthus annuus TaxID=4232 RepID=A0A251TBY2_HELAN